MGKDYLDEEIIRLLPHYLRHPINCLGRSQYNVNLPSGDRELGGTIISVSAYLTTLINKLYPNIEAPRNFDSVKVGVASSSGTRLSACTHAVCPRYNIFVNTSIQLRADIVRVLRHDGK